MKTVPYHDCGKGEETEGDQRDEKQATETGTEHVFICLHEPVEEMKNIGHFKSNICDLFLYFDLQFKMIS
jgi:hypothetical protein